jgi:hypothetical protein
VAVFLQSLIPFSPRESVWKADDTLFGICLALCVGPIILSAGFPEDDPVLRRCIPAPILRRSNAREMTDRII